MGLTQAVKTCLGKYAVFSGRATRSEYWWFVLFVILVGVVLALIDTAIFGVNPETGEASGILSPLFQLAVFLPMLAAGWRRLHDTGRPGWYLLLPMALSVVTMIILFGGIAVFAMLERGVDDPEVLRGPAEFLGITGVLVVLALQFGLTVLLIWWLTRPSEDGPIRVGPPLS